MFLFELIHNNFKLTKSWFARIFFMFYLGKMTDLLKKCYFLTEIGNFFNYFLLNFKRKKIGN